jgi:hypothetical protein
VRPHPCSPLHNPVLSLLQSLLFSQVRGHLPCRHITHLPNQLFNRRSSLPVSRRLCRLQVLRSCLPSNRAIFLVQCRALSRLLYHPYVRVWFRRVAPLGLHLRSHIQCHLCSPPGHHPVNRQYSLRQFQQYSRLRCRHTSHPGDPVPRLLVALLRCRLRVRPRNRVLGRHCSLKSIPPRGLLINPRWNLPNSRLCSLFLGPPPNHPQYRP